MKSSYRLRNITTRTTYADGSSVTAGPPVSATYPLGYFREDYEYIATTSLTPDYLDAHNGRFCVTPEYPNGIYCYFATVNASWNSAYPYVVGPAFYGVRSAAKITSITEPVTVYTPSTVGIADLNTGQQYVNIFAVPAGDLIVIQSNDLTRENMLIDLYDLTGRLVQKTILYQGSTLAYFDTRTLYSGEYIIKTTKGTELFSKKISIVK